MKILRGVRWAFSCAGYLPDERIFDFKYVHAITSFLFILTLILAEITSITYVMHHLKIGDYLNCIYAGLQIAAVSPELVSVFTMMYHKDKVHDVIHGFQTIFDKCNEYRPDMHFRYRMYSILCYINSFAGEGKRSAAYFNRADRLSEKYFLVLSTLVGFIIALSLALAAVTCGYYYKRDGHIEFRNIYLPYKTRCDSPFIR